MADSSTRRFTKPRQRVLDALRAAGKPMKAYDLVDALGDVKPMTVYRALDFLVEEGLAHRIGALNAFVLCHETHCAHRDSQYFICDACGAVGELHDHDINAALAAAVAKMGALFRLADVEVRGTCAACR